MVTLAQCCEFADEKISTAVPVQSISAFVFFRRIKHAILVFEILFEVSWVVQSLQFWIHKSPIAVTLSVDFHHGYDMDAVQRYTTGNKAKLSYSFEAVRWIRHTC